MKKLLICFVALMLFFAYAEKSHAVLGIPDHVPAATVIVPFFEVGIDSVAHPNDTLPVIFGNAAVKVHYEVWDINGNLADIFGDFDIGFAESKSFSMRSLINAASAGQKAQLTVGDYYWGFVTFDVVTGSTMLPPTNGGYPFSSSNSLEGFIYYTRLSQGSSNGLPMVAIEAVPPMTGALLHGFYQGGDNREEIDSDARYSAIVGSSTTNPNGGIYRVHSRLYLDFANGATDKVIVFTFPQAGSSLGSNFPGSVPYKRYHADGSLAVDTTYNLNHVVNVISYVSIFGDTSGTTSGALSLWNIPSGFETYAFSINSANPPGHPELTWDAIFESFINPAP